MSEEAFEHQEALRKEVELRKSRLQSGTPMPGSVEEFLQLFEKTLRDAPLLEEFIRREHLSNQEVIKSLQRYYDQEMLKEQGDNINGLTSDFQGMQSLLQELLSRLNTEYADQKAHRERVQQTCDKIDAALRDL